MNDMEIRKGLRSILASHHCCNRSAVLSISVPSLRCAASVAAENCRCGAILALHAVFCLSIVAKELEGSHGGKSPFAPGMPAFLRDIIQKSPIKLKCTLDKDLLPASGVKKCGNRPALPVLFNAGQLDVGTIALEEGVWAAALEDVVAHDEMPDHGRPAASARPRPGWLRHAHLRLLDSAQILSSTADASVM